MRKFFCLTLFFTVACTINAIAQKALPFIDVKNINGKVIVSWINKYHRMARLVSIQRSDDNRDFTTIATVLSPENIDNGYADARPPYANMYYRVFVVFDGGKYVYSEVKRAGKDVMAFDLTTGDSIALQSVVPSNTKRNNRVYTGKENNVMINLPDAEVRKYSIKFFDENDKPVFEINKLQESGLIIDKVNFVHAGWFYYEVYEKGKLLEKDRFYIAADNKTQVPVSNEKGKRNNR